MVDQEPTLLLISPAQLPRWIEATLPHIKKMAAGSGGRYLAEDIVGEIVRARMQMWVVLIQAEIACVVVTEIHNYPRVRVLRLLGLVGRGWRRWVKLTAQVEQWAREQGCTMSESLLAGSKWMTLLPGYRMDHLRVVKAL